MPTLTDPQRRALERLWSSQHSAEPAGAFGRGIGTKTLEGLVELGLATHGVDRFGDEGYLITEVGREAFGKGRY